MASPLPITSVDLTKDPTIRGRKERIIIEDCGPNNVPVLKNNALQRGVIIWTSLPSSDSVPLGASTAITPSVVSSGRSNIVPFVAAECAFSNMKSHPMLVTKVHSPERRLDKRTDFIIKVEGVIIRTFDGARRTPVWSNPSSYYASTTEGESYLRVRSNLPFFLPNPHPPLILSYQREFLPGTPLVPQAQNILSWASAHTTTVQIATNHRQDLSTVESDCSHTLPEGLLTLLFLTQPFLRVSERIFRLTTLSVAEEDVVQLEQHIAELVTRGLPQGGGGTGGGPKSGGSSGARPSRWGAVPPAGALRNSSAAKLHPAMSANTFPISTPPSSSSPRHPTTTHGVSHESPPALTDDPDDSGLFLVKLTEGGEIDFLLDELSDDEAEEWRREQRLAVKEEQQKIDNWLVRVEK